MEHQKSKKILFIVQLPPPVHGVSQMNDQLINSRVIRKNYEIDIVNFQFVKSVSSIAKISIGKLLKAAKYAFQIFGKVLFGRPDLVYFTIAPTGGAFYRDAVYVAILKALNAKIAIHLYGKRIREITEESAWKKRVYQWVFKNTEIICQSRRLTEDIAGVYEPAPFIVANGIPEIEGIKDKKERIKNDPSQLFYLSNFFTTKGILVLIEALKILQEESHDFTARLVGASGDLSLETISQKIEQENLSDKVELVGPIYGPDKFIALQNADIFVHPTYNDAFPLVILEALQCGLPVVSTYEGGIPNIIDEGETGFLVETQNPEMLAEKIALLLKNEALRLAMARKAKNHFHNNFTVAAFANNMNKVFATILGLKPDINLLKEKKIKYEITDHLN